MYKTERMIRQELGEYLYAHFGVEHLSEPDPLIERAITAIMKMFDDIPDNWAKVDGKWVEIPDEHYVNFTDDGWLLEHSLPCRIRGLARCPLNQMMGWFDQMENGRYLVEIDDAGVQLIEESAV